MTGCASFRSAAAICAGLVAGATVWAVNVQLGQILPYVDCARHARYSAILSVAWLFMAAATSFLSWRHGTARNRAEQTSSLRFFASLSALAGLVFAFALALQVAASLVLTGCER